MGDNLRQHSSQNKRNRRWSSTLVEEGCGDTKKSRRNLPPTPARGYNVRPDADSISSHPSMNSAARRNLGLGPQRGTPATFRNNVRASGTHHRSDCPVQNKLSSAQKREKRRLQSMGRTNNSAIDLGSDDEEEIVVVGVKQTVNTRANISAPRSQVQPLAIPARCAFLAGRSLPQFNQSNYKNSTDPPAFLPHRSPESSVESSVSESTTASLNRRARQLQLVNDRRGREDAPEIKFDVDTEEDFENMDIEVISISSDDEEQDDYYESDDSDTDEDEKLEEKYDREFARAVQARQEFLVTQKSGGGFTVDPKFVLPKPRWGHLCPPRVWPSASLQQPPTGTNTSSSQFSNGFHERFPFAPYAPNGTDLYRGKITQGPPPRNREPKRKTPEVIDLYSSDEEEEVALGKSKRNENISASEEEEDAKPPARDTSSNLDASMGLLRSSPEEQVDPTDIERSNETHNDSALSSHMPAGEGTKELQANPRSDSLLGDAEEEAVGFPQKGVPKRKGSRPYSCNKFEWLWRYSEGCLGKTTQEIEEGKDFKCKASKKNEQYGRILPKGMVKIFNEVMKIQRDDVFLDIGHGIGNTCLQAAFTVGCDAKGIECIPGRCIVADKFEAHFRSIAEVHRRRDGMTFRPGKVELKCGELQNPKFREWMVSDTTKIFVNNFSSSFVKGQDASLHAHLAALFADMREGTMMVTMAALSSQMGCLPLKAANKKRRMLGLPESPNASYYEVKGLPIGKQRDIVSWSIGSSCVHDLEAYRYVRVGKPTYLCNNIDCAAAIACVPIEAVKEDANGVLTIGVCDCRYSDRPVRERKQTSFFGK